ncbi:MAG: hydrogenase nickel incorporation protein HypB [bacterium]|nr:hydrogenase nickel incorporation protein HypB [bacterium]
MKIEVFKRLQAGNDAEADEVRRLLAPHGITLINIMGSPGSGKTTLLEATLKSLGRAPSPLRCAVLEGDLATIQDAERIADLNVPVAQLLTEGGCHLTAGLVHHALSAKDAFDLDALDCVFVENVGNLVCPANFDLGEHARVVVLSVAEGDDKITKYPHTFRAAGNGSAVVLSKLDLLPQCRFDLERARRDLSAINPQAALFEVGAIDGTGVEAWAQWVREVGANSSETDSPPAPT